MPEFWGLNCHTDDIVKKLPEGDEEWDTFTTKLHDYFVVQKKSHMTNHFLFTAGDDFMYYKNAE